MMEIVFGDSTCASLRMAQDYGEGAYRMAAIGVMIRHEDGREPTREEIEEAQREAERKERDKWEAAKPMGGKRADIYGFNLVLSVGDISEDEPGEKRQQVLERLYSVFPKDAGDQGDSMVTAIFRRIDANLRAVRERALSGESVRVWYSDQPDEMCGLYWFLERLDRWGAHDAPVFVVKMPDWEPDADGFILRKRGWGDVQSHEWHRYPPLQLSLAPAFREDCAARWRDLRRENAPLRAVINGELVGVSETLYDDYIRRAIDRQDDVFNEAVVIGRVLTDHHFGIGDGWIAARIEAMIRAGALEVVTEADGDMPSYNRMLRKRALG